MYPTSFSKYFYSVEPIVTDREFCRVLFGHVYRRELRFDQVGPSMSAGFTTGEVSETTSSSADIRQIVVEFGTRLVAIDLAII